MGRLSSRSAVEKPKPWTRPKAKLTIHRRVTVGRAKRFSVATAAMDSAITDSTRRSGSVTTSSAARVSVTLCATVNAVTIFTIAKMPPPVSSRASRKRRWSHPVTMCSTPSATKPASPRAPPSPPSVTRSSRRSGAKANGVVAPAPSIRPTVW